MIMEVSKMSKTEYDLKAICILPMTHPINCAIYVHTCARQSHVIIRSAPDGPRVGPMNLAIRVFNAPTMVHMLCTHGYQWKYGFQLQLRFFKKSKSFKIRFYSYTTSLCLLAIRFRTTSRDNVQRILTTWLKKCTRFDRADDKVTNHFSYVDKWHSSSLMPCQKCIPISHRHAYETADYPTVLRITKYT